MPDTKVEGPQFGDPEITAGRAQMYVRAFQEDVYGPRAADWIQKFCTDSTIRAHDLSREAQERCIGNEDARIKLAGSMKYIIAHLELAACYGKQIGIMSEHEGFRARALSYVAIARAELEALEFFEPSRSAA